MTFDFDKCRSLPTRICHKIIFLAVAASVKASQLHWRFKHPDISRNAIVFKDCRIERHKGSRLQIQKGCVIQGGVNIGVKNRGVIAFDREVMVRQNCYFESFGSLVVGRNSGFNIGCYVVALNKICIGEYVMIGPHAVIVDHDHKMDDLNLPMLLQGQKTSPVVIHDDVWIGAHVTVTKGVDIGKGAVIGANAVVTHDIPEYGIAVGVPAKVVGYRKAATVPSHESLVIG